MFIFFFSSFEKGSTEYIIFGIIFILFIIMLGSIYIFIGSQIRKIKSLMNVVPIKCTIEDFIVTSTLNDHKRVYTLNPVVRSSIDNKLYFAFDNYCLSGYRQSYDKLDCLPISKAIVRNDNSIVNLGDVVYLFIYKDINPKIKIDENKNTVTLKCTTHKFMDANKYYNINIFNELNYFEELIEIEVEQK